jgi:ATP-binding cassette subfamily B multidrug efflux pump
MIVTQKISTAQQADHIFMVEDGKVAVSGTHGDLAEQNGLYKRLIESQGRKEDAYEQTWR